MGRRNDDIESDDQATPTEAEQSVTDAAPEPADIESEDAGQTTERVSEESEDSTSSRTTSP